MMSSHLRFVLRKFSRERQFFLINLIGLGTGLACSILIFLWVQDELTVDAFHEKNSRLYKAMYNIKTSNEVLTVGFTPSPLGEALTTEFPEVEQTVAVNPFIDWFAGQGVVSTSNNKNTRAKGIFAGQDFFDVFSFRLLQGDKSKVLADKNGIVISAQLAKKLFNTTENIIGKEIEWEHRMNLRGPFVITGVFETPPSTSTLQFDLAFNYQRLYEVDANAKNWNATYAETYLVLKEGTDPVQFSKKIAALPGAKDPSMHNCTLLLQQYSKGYLHGHYENGVQTGGRVQYVRLFSIIAIFIVVIACINFMNLVTAQASKRMKEIGIRKTLGASRGKLIIQLLGESLLITLLSVTLSVFLVSALLNQFNTITGKQLSFNLDGQLLLTLLTLTVFVGILSGCYPAFYLSRFKPMAALKSRFNTVWSELMVRKGLVIFQFTLSVAFIIGFFVIRQQMAFIQNRHLGYNKENIISIKREGGGNEKTETLLAILKKLPGVEQASCMPESILDGHDTQAGFSWRGEKTDEGFLFKSPRISYDVIETLGMKLLAGRTFSRTFNDDESKLVLNESAVKKMELKSPVGKIIKTGNSNSEIIGVVKDFQYGSLHQSIEPLIFRFRKSHVGNILLVKLSTQNMQATLQQIETQYNKFYPKYPFEFTFLDEDYQKLYASEQRMEGLSKYFAGLAILISCLGLFGLTAFAAQQRQKEIAIRKIIGASAASVFALLCRDVLKPVLIAVIIAFPIAWWAMNTWLMEFPYRIHFGWWIFAIAGIIVLLIAMATISLQAIKAAIINPVKSLKTE